MMVNIKTTKTEFKELLSALDKASAFVCDNATKYRDLDLSRRLTKVRMLLEKRNGSIQGEDSDCD